MKFSDQHILWIAQWFVETIAKTGEAPIGIEPFLQDPEAGNLTSA